MSSSSGRSSSSPGIVTRPLAQTDRGPLVALLRSTGAFSEEEVRVALELIDTVLLPGIDQGYLFVIAADSKDRPIGYACWGATPLTQGVFDLYWIAVDPARQSTGIGRMLLDHVRAAVRESGGRMILAETASKDAYAATRAFYERAGFSEIARVPDFYRVGDDKIIYRMPADR